MGMLIGVLEGISMKFSQGKKEWGLVKIIEEGAWLCFEVS